MMYLSEEFSLHSFHFSHAQCPVKNFWNDRKMLPGRVCGRSGVPLDPGKFRQLPPKSSAG